MTPSGWKEVSLAEIGEIISGLTYSPEDVRDDGLLVYRSSNIKHGKIVYDNNVYVEAEVSEDKLSRAGDILICVRNGSRSLIGKSALIPKDIPKATHGAFMTVLRAAEPDFAFQLLQTPIFRRQVDANLGATINSINGSDLKKYKFPFPPRVEREKIAKILTIWDQGSEIASRLFKQVQVRKNCYLKVIFSSMRHGTAELGSFCVFKGGSGFKEIYQGKSSGHYPFIKVSDFNNQGNEKFITNANNWIEIADQEKLKPYIFPAGTVCFAKVGAALLLNKRRIITRPTCMDNNTMGALPIEGKCLTEFLYQFLLTIDLKEFSQAGALPSVNQGELSSIKVSFPEINEQKSIGDFLSAMDVELQLLRQRVRYFETQKLGLMQQLLTGKKRVKV